MHCYLVFLAFLEWPAKFVCQDDNYCSYCQYSTITKHGEMMV